MTDPKHLTPADVLSFTGFVETVRDGIAYCTFYIDGQRYTAQYAWDRMQAAGCRERRRFTVHCHYRLAFEDVPDVQISPEQQAEFEKRLDNLFDGWECDGPEATDPR